MRRIFSRIYGDGLARRRGGHRGGSRAGFTLLELLVVMGIMLFLSMAVVGSYVGMTRAIAARAGINHLRNAVMLTRQHACMDGQRTYLYTLNATEYVLCRRVGVVTQGRSGSFADFYSDLSSLRDSVPRYVADRDRLKIFNLSRNIADSKEPFVYLGRADGVAPVKEDRVNGGWTVSYQPNTKFFDDGDSYGVEVYPLRTLPKGFVFDAKSVGKAMYFEPSGKPSVNSGNLVDKLEIREVIKPNLVQSVFVDGGKIKVETKGTEK